MEALHYTPRETADLLDVPLKVLSAALSRDTYSPEELWGLRERLRRQPAPVGHRKQLFLNFKGGTGKTSLSTSYAWRLAELEWRLAGGGEVADACGEPYA